MTCNVVSRFVIQAIAGLGITALLYGCSVRDAEPSFHPLPEFANVQTVDHNGKALSIRNDFVVIANPPADRKELQALVDAYNEKTLTAEQLSRQFGYIRWFYKESAKMPRDYKESHKSYFEIDRLEHHGEDIVLIVKWGEFGKELSYEFP